MKYFLVIMLIVMQAIYGYSQYEIEYHWDTIDFELPYEYLEIDSSINNIWQRGRPQKIFFDSAYSPQKAILTDSINFYPVNNHSFFDLKIGSFNFEWLYPGNIFIGFEHKYDTDSLKDGGFLTISYDKGRTWVNIIDDHIYFEYPESYNLNLYSDADTLFNGERGFSGHSDEWVSTYFGWLKASVKKVTTNYVDTLVLRFNFISDSIHTDKEGWMIDNIRLYSVYNSGIDDIKDDGWLKLFPNPASTDINISIRNDLPFTASLYDLSGRMVLGQSNRQVIDITDYPPGVYFVRVVADKKVIVKKIMIRR